MRVQALLCDAATVREGLLHILGGGITQIWRESFPAPMGVSLALLITLHPTETGEVHSMRILCQGEDGNALMTAEAEFAAEKGAQYKAGKAICLPLVIALHNFGLPGPGMYSVEITVDRQHCFSLPFSADLASVMRGS